MNEFFKEVREYGVVFLNEVIRFLREDKIKVSIVLKLYCFWEVKRYSFFNYFGIYC